MTDDNLRRLENDVASLKAEVNRLGITSAVIQAKLEDIAKDIASLSADDKWVSLAEFSPVKRLVYGAAARHCFLTLATIASIIMTAAGAVLIWWLIQPTFTTLPNVAQPIPILNRDNVIAVGEPIRMELRINKPLPIASEGSTRIMQCDSGLLDTFTPSTRDLPIGEYTLISDSTILPNSIIEEDTCRVVWRVRYEVNPLRHVTTEFVTEPFTTILER